LLKAREKEVHDGECEFESDEDETLFQYCSEDEGVPQLRSTVMMSDDE
jgi:hypothetical protein